MNLKITIENEDKHAQFIYEGDMLPPLNKIKKTINKEIAYFYHNFKENRHKTESVPLKCDPTSGLCKLNKKTEKQK